MHDLLMTVIIGLLLVTKLICRLVLNDNFERRRSYSKQEITVSSQVCVRNKFYSCKFSIFLGYRSYVDGDDDFAKHG